MPTPYSTHLYEEVTSTQDVARSLGLKGPVLVIAARQTAGRGRASSAWETASRALAMSLKVEPVELGWPRGRFTLIPLAAGIAVARLFKLALKWPNDLLTKEAKENEGKVGGILIEAFGPEVTIGIGLNLWWPEPPPGRSALGIEDPGTSAYATLGAEVAEAVWAELARGVEGWSYDEYCSSCVTLGQQITWSGGESGIAVEIDRIDGALLVETANGRLKLNAGTIRHVRGSDASG